MGNHISRRARLEQLIERRIGIDFTLKELAKLMKENPKSYEEFKIKIEERIKSLSSENKLVNEEIGDNLEYYRQLEEEM